MEYITCADVVCGRPAVKYTMHKKTFNMVWEILKDMKLITALLKNVIDTNTLSVNVKNT